MRPKTIGALFGVGLAIGCGQSPEPPPGPTIESALQALVDAAVADHPEVPGAVLHIDSNEVGLDWEGAAGDAEPEIHAPMSPARPVRIASNTKTFVAAAVLRLAEEGRLDIDDPIADYLPAAFVELLRGDGYKPEAITIRHLLTHTSGLFDHSSGPEYEEAIVADPMHRWTREEQLRAAIEWGDPHAAPGEVYTYCDTGYVLLGGIVERASGRPLAAAVRELIGYQKLGMTSTWWESLEPAPDGVPWRAHQFLGDLDTFSFDPSFDLYGGGGIVSTMGDLARFWRALFTGRVYSNPETLATMLTTFDGLRGLPEDGPGALPPGAYRMGVWAVEVNGLTVYRHTGFWGTSASFVPQLDLVVTATVNQNRAREALDELVGGAIGFAEARAVVESAEDQGP